VVCAAACLVAGRAAAEPQVVRMGSRAPAEANEMSAKVDSLLQGGRLRVARLENDALLPGRRHQRLDQYHAGVPVFGGQVVRQTDETGAVISVSGKLYEGLDVDVRPTVSTARARAAALAGAGSRSSLVTEPELLILPVADDRLALVWAVAVSIGVDVRRYYVDAHGGEVVREHSLLSKQAAAVGRGTGVLSNDQKVSAAASGGQFVAIDMLRPARITTYDLRFDVLRSVDVLNRFFDGVPPASGDVAADSDNSWTDGPTVDAHSYAGWVYDYYFKRLGRRGWNDADLEIPQFVNPARPDEYFVYGRDIPEFFANAFFCCSGLPVNFMAYGQGAPVGVVPGGAIRPLAGSLDVVAHEITHGVTKFTSALSLAFCYAGGLNESFSDVMAVSTEFYYRPTTANYRVGEDVWPGGIRDMGDPGLFNLAGRFKHPDHIEVANVCEEHYLAGVPNQAFYLAIEGGTNRTSRLAVRGVGGANREQIEKVFYRAFTLKLGPASDYFDAANATVQAARELYGPGSAAERAVIEAWTAVLTF
jgi:Zn-dependent metalloprotease